MSKRILKWLTLTIRIVVLIPGKINFRRLSRYGGHPPKTIATNIKDEVKWLKEGYLHLAVAQFKRLIYELYLAPTIISTYGKSPHLIITQKINHNLAEIAA